MLRRAPYWDPELGDHGHGCLGGAFSRGLRQPQVIWLEGNTLTSLSPFLYAPSLQISLRLILTRSQSTGNLCGCLPPSTEQGNEKRMDQGMSREYLRHLICSFSVNLFPFSLAFHVIFPPIFTQPSLGNSSLSFPQVRV